MKRMQNLGMAMTIIIAVNLSACDTSLNGEVGSAGTASIAITDAAVDAQNITGVYLAVNEIQARSGSNTRTVLQFDTPKSFNLMDYQNGATFDLGEGELESGAYSELRLVLEEGSNYIRFEDGSTSELEIEGDGSYSIAGDFDITAESKSRLVADIDLRKALVTDEEEHFRLRTTARVINRDHTGTIKGTMAQSGEDQVVVYAYTRGTYEAGEADAPSSGHTRFQGSVNSAVVSNGSFTLAFMEEGEYDLIAVAYSENEAENRMEFKSATKAEVMLGGELVEFLNVKANTTANVLIHFSF